MLDINILRQNPGLVKENLKKRFETEKIMYVDEITLLDKQWRTLKKQTDSLKHEKNTLSQEINILVKQKKNATEKIKQAQSIQEQLKETEKNTDTLKDKINNYLIRLPNILDKSVPYGKEASKNKVLRKFGRVPKFDFKIKTHVELLEKLDLADFDRSSKISGTGFYILKGKMFLLNHALIRFAIDILHKKNYTLIEPPYLMRKKPYIGATDIKNLDNMYKLENEDLFLIGTSEHPLAAMHMNESFNEKDLPLKYAAYSMCFRKEIGAHGINEKGIFRTHQFNKVEQFIFCKEEEAEKYHKEIINNAELILKKLKIPYRVVLMCSGETGAAASKQLDIEAYMPTEKNYREVVSGSNCTTYQSKGLNIKYLKGNEKHYTYTLNSTAIATSRTLRAIIENYQQKDGSIRIPTILISYMNGIKKLP